MVLTVVEMLQMKKIMGDDDLTYKQVNSESVMNALSMDGPGPDDSMDKKMR